MVFMLWGCHAKQVWKRRPIDDKKHCLLRAGHPSRPKFSSCKHFSKANAYLKGTNKQPIA